MNEATVLPETNTTARGPIRNFLESIGMAILMAVLLKYFVLEAYVIPTPSMQPTLMGSPGAGETDRILVDKSYFLRHEPKRWDIAVFRYPVRQIQSYVKRIVGVGGDQLMVAGGNLYNAADSGREILRKPEHIQESLWREIYPMRRQLELHNKGDDDPWRPPTREEVFRGEYFRILSGSWDIDAEGTWLGTPSPSGNLAVEYRESFARNDYRDGYDLAVAALLRDTVGDQAVQDLRIGFDLTTDTSPEKIIVSINIQEQDTSFELVVAGEMARLVATRGSTTGSSEEFPFPIEAGDTTNVRFAHLDDRLLAWRDGDLVGSFDVDEFAILEDLEEIRPGILIEGADSTCRLAEVSIERDLHYTSAGLANAGAIIEVPEGHYFMMGDNTLGSADSRDWTAVRIGMDEEGRIVDPDSNENARALWGNKRPKPFDTGEPPHDDDNPVPLLDGRVVFVDQLGEIRTLQSRVNPRTWGNGQVEFLDDTGASWFPKQEPMPFVRREHIQGRPIARFLRSAFALKFTGWIR